MWRVHLISIALSVLCASCTRSHVAEAVRQSVDLASAKVAGVDGQAHIIKHGTVSEISNTATSGDFASKSNLTIAVDVRDAALATAVNTSFNRSGTHDSIAAAGVFEHLQQSAITASQEERLAPPGAEAEQDISLDVSVHPRPEERRGSASIAVKNPTITPMMIGFVCLGIVLGWCCCLMVIPGVLDQKSGASVDGHDGPKATTPSGHYRHSPMNLRSKASHFFNKSKKAEDTLGKASEGSIEHATDTD